MNGIDPLGLIDLNLHAPGSVLQRSFDDYSESGSYTVSGHGMPTHIRDDSSGISRRLYAQGLANLMKQNGYQEGQTVKLLSCETGAGQDPFAQKLADEIQAIVIAPTDKLEVKSLELFGGYFTFFLEMRVLNGGSFKTFYPSSSPSQDPTTSVR